MLYVTSRSCQLSPLIPWPRTAARRGFAAASALGRRARFARMARLRGLAETLVGQYLVAFAMLMGHRFVTFMLQST
jgi:hypothetical protein